MTFTRKKASRPCKERPAGMQYPDVILTRINFTQRMQFTEREDMTELAQREMHAEIIQIRANKLISSSCTRYHEVPLHYI